MTVFAHNIKYAYSSSTKCQLHGCKLTISVLSILVIAYRPLLNAWGIWVSHAHPRWTVSTVMRLWSYGSESWTVLCRHLHLSRDSSPRVPSLRCLDVGLIVWMMNTLNNFCYWRPTLSDGTVIEWFIDRLKEQWMTNSTATILDKVH